MYALWAVPATLEIRTHEDGHVPSCLQPLQVALLRETLPRPPHPPRAGATSQKVTFRLVIHYFLGGKKLLFEERLVTFCKYHFG